MPFNSTSTILLLLCFLCISKTNFARMPLPCLNGSYTVGGTNPDYATFTDAVAELETSGVCGPVVFEVRSGTYMEQLSIDEIAGASAVNTITFKSETGLNTDVTLQFASSTAFADPNYTLQLNGADYFRFEDMTIERTGTNLYANVIEFVGSASYNILDGNRILGKVNNPSSGNSENIICEDANADNTQNAFTNNEIIGGYSGIYWEGSNGTPLTNLTVNNNTFELYRYGIYLRYTENVIITANTIVVGADYNSPSNSGIELFRAEENLTVTSNTITLTDATSNYGITLGACTSNSGAVGNISNNMVVVGGTGTSQGINSGSLTSYKNYYHNSCYTTGTHATSASAFYMNGSNNINIKNNAFFGTIGNAIEVLTTSGVLSSNYNLLYSTGPYVGKWSSDQATLADYQTASGGDANSISADPLFVSATDLHVLPGSPTDATAVTALGIATDIDGDTRDLVVPDIGADEAGSIIMGVEEATSGFSIYATSNNMIVVETETSDNIYGVIEVTDMTGKKVAFNNINITHGVGRVATKSIANGVYAITFVPSTGNRVTSTKLVLGQE